MNRASRIKRLYKKIYHTHLESRKDRRERMGVENIFEETVAENYPNFVKYINYRFKNLGELLTGKI